MIGLSAPFSRGSIIGAAMLIVVGSNCLGTRYASDHLQSNTDGRFSSVFPFTLRIKYEFLDLSNDPVCFRPVKCSLRFAKLCCSP
jgi:hypothetical protein